MKNFGLLLCLLFTFQTALNAQTGKKTASTPALAFAYPVSHISIDGDTSDWPKNQTRYPLGNFSGRRPDSTTAYFRTGYNQAEQTIYILVVVKNDTHLIDTTKNATADTQDCYSLYLDNKNLPEGSGVVTYRFNEIWKGMSRVSESWDPDTRKAGWDNVRTACKTNGSTTIYECSVMLKDKIYAGRSFGIDHVVTDRDTADKGYRTNYLFWGDRYDKDNSPGRLGFLILMRSGERTGSVAGKLKWEDPVIKNYPERLRVTSVKDPALQFLVPVDTAGQYSFALPAGTYEICSLWSFQRIGDEIYKIDKDRSKLTFRIRAGRSSEVPALSLKTVTAPDLLPEKGILADFDEKKAIQLDDFVKAYQKYYIIPGVSLALIKNGKVIYHKTYGVKNAFTGEPVNDSTLFEAASITKTVFAFAVNSLAEKGIIDLDKPLYLYLPFEEIAYDERYKLMTARHVLSHQTGLPNWSYMEPDGKLRLKFTPGTGYGYSGEGFEYLKRVVVKITGKDIETVLNDEVIRPLGLQNIYFSKNDYLARVTAFGHYENFPTKSALPDSPGMAWSMYTEAVSFSRFVLALQNRKVLKPGTYDEMFRFQSTVTLDEKEKKEGLDLHYGLGIALENTPYGFVFEHGGNNGDFQCEFMMFRDLNTGFVIFTNSDSGGRLAYEDLKKLLITGKGNK